MEWIPKRVVGEVVQVMATDDMVEQGLSGDFGPVMEVLPEEHQYYVNLAKNGTKQLRGSVLLSHVPRPAGSTECQPSCRCKCNRETVEKPPVDKPVGADGTF